MKVVTFDFQAFRESSQNRDLGLGDEIKDDEAEDPGLASMQEKCLEPVTPSPVVRSFKQRDEVTEADKECKFSLMAAIANTNLSMADRLALIRDPKLMRSRVQVRLEKVTAAPGPSSRMLKRALKRKRSECENHSTWFAKRSVVVRSIHSTTTTSSSSHPSPTLKANGLIRPAVLNVSPSKTNQDLGKFSSANTSTLISSQPLNSNVTNPFLPPAKSTFLFGFSEFEAVPPEERLVISEEDDEDEDEDDDLVIQTDVEDSTTDTPPSLPPPPPPPASPPQPLEPQQQQKLVAEAVANAEDVLLHPDKAVASTTANASPVVTELPATKLRFPAPKIPTTNLIECKWQGCQMKFTTYGKLSDHLKVRAEFLSFPPLSPN